MEEKLPTLDLKAVVYFYIPWATVKANTDFMLFSSKLVFIITQPFHKMKLYYIIAILPTL